MVGMKCRNYTLHSRFLWTKVVNLFSLWANLLGLWGQDGYREITFENQAVGDVGVFITRNFKYAKK